MLHDICKSNTGCKNEFSRPTKRSYTTINSLKVKHDSCYNRPESLVTPSKKQKPSQTVTPDSTSRSTMTREFKNLKSTFMGGRIETIKGNKDQTVNESNAKKDTKINAPNRIINFNKLSALIENNFACRDCSYTSMKSYEWQIIDILSKSLTKYGIVGEKKFNIMKHTTEELESVDLPTIPSMKVCEVIRGVSSSITFECACNMSNSSCLEHSSSSCNSHTELADDNLSISSKTHFHHHHVQQNYINLQSLEKLK